MYHRSAVLMAVAGLLACSGYAMADTSPKLSLDPTVVTADAAAPQGALMLGLDQIGVGKPLNDLKLNIYGWIESGYTYDHRHGSDNNKVIIPGPFNHEYGNHYMLNQFDLRFERLVDPTKFDVGGLLEVMYGSDAARIHPYGGFGFNGSDLSDDNIPADKVAVDNYHPILQFDIPQVYIDVNLPVAKGLDIRIGKFVALFGYEAIDPRGNPFYSHSYLFSATPFTQSGILGSLQLTDQFGVKLGVTRGWDMATEDNNGAIDVIGQFSFQVSKQLNVVLNWSSGPENANDSSHYRTALDPIVYWQVTDALKLGLEGYYLYDGGLNGNISGFSEGRTHAYGDIWGAALYAGYTINDNLTLNARLEKAHGDIGQWAGVDFVSQFGTVPALSVYEITLGVTVTPLPKVACLKGLVVRPEIRYDFTDSTAYKFFYAGGKEYKDQLTFACDVIFAF